jgi:Virulence activator alpha C-term
LQRELHQEKLAAYHQIAENFSSQPKHDIPDLKRDQEFWRLTLELGTRYEEAYIGWLQDAIRKIEAL